MIVIKTYGYDDVLMKIDDDDDTDGGRSIMTHNKGAGCFIINWFPFCETRDERKY